LKRAWLIEWESWSPEILEETKFSNPALILNYRLSAETVRRIVEALYASNEFDLSEKFNHAKNAKNNPYPAKFDQLAGVTCGNGMTCGHSPSLRARIVKNLKLLYRGDGNSAYEFDDLNPEEVMNNLRRWKLIRDDA
jgi:hypothetical protein